MMMVTIYVCTVLLRRFNMNIKYSQLGLSMIELMVALAISSFLILGITQIYIDNKRSYLFQQGQMENNDSVRYVTYFLDNELQKIGYRRRPDSSYESVFLSKGDFSSNEIIKIDSEYKVRFRYQPHSGSDYACDGSVSSESDIDDMYEGGAIEPRVVSIEFNKDTGVIKCNDQEVVSNVLEFNFLYAVPVNNASSIEGVKYVEFADISSASKIRGIRYRALFSSSAKNLADYGASKAVDAFYEDADDKPDDKAVYQLLIKTAMLRNIISW